MFCTDTLRHRETARNILERLSKTPKNDLVIIDFDKIEFASRSFLHELMSCLADRKVEFKNQNEEVARMTDVISKSIEAYSDERFGKHCVATAQ
jgi:anti-anti-sigma regulatory factor